MTHVPAGPVSREVALRIALAAHALPHSDVGAFLGALGARLGMPLTIEKLGKVTVEDLQRALQDDNDADSVERAALKQAVRYLWGEDIVDADAPVPQPYTEGDMPGSIRVAVASNSEEHVDGHFGSCLRFLIYQLSRDEIRLIDARSTRPTDEANDRNAARAQLISDCHLVYVRSIGGPAAAKVVRAGLHPVKFPQQAGAPATLARLQAVLDAPPPWLAKIIGVSPRSLARFVEDIDA